MTVSERGKTIIATAIASAAIYYGVENLIDTQCRKLHLAGANTRIYKLEQRIEQLERGGDLSPMHNMPTGARPLRTTNGQTVWFVPCATTNADVKPSSTPKPNLP